ncbi:hypothetical protein CGGC5_v012246 [Colletotrichum fructicola Nara gc5]|uniref:Uncharacterized protein n=1 Tax=Colletotrichum fructicola (strain Nara gc5) TaxID=1213859 RepID=A0A7J6ISA2_COLFN|nr:hypothetical protein CGGC5_v012246 [Colletotrichum fructicola Nara gc5]
MPFKHGGDAILKASLRKGAGTLAIQSRSHRDVGTAFALLCPSWATERDPFLKIQIPKSDKPSGRPPPSSPRGLDIAAAIILPKPLIRVSLGLCYRANHPRSRTECPGQRRPGHEQMVYTSLAHRRGLATIFPQ